MWFLSDEKNLYWFSWLKKVTKQTVVTGKHNFILFGFVSISPDPPEQPIFLTSNCSLGALFPSRGQPVYSVSKILSVKYNYHWVCVSYPKLRSAPLHRLKMEFKGRLMSCTLIRAFMCLYCWWIAATMLRRELENCLYVFFLTLSMVMCRDFVLVTNVLIVTLDKSLF